MTEGEIHMKRDDFSHGFPEQVWLAAKEEARQAMIDVARRSSTMSYSDLAPLRESPGASVGI